MTDETEFPETAQPRPQPGSATGEIVLLTVDETAGILGISPQAVRKRISKGQLNARRDGRAWLVILERETIATGETGTAATAPKPNETAGAQPRNLVAAQQAEQMEALVTSIQAPLLDRIEAASREAERERVARRAAEQERDELQAEVQLLREIERVHDSHEDTEPFTPVSPLEAPGDEEAAQVSSTGASGIVAVRGVGQAFRAVLMVDADRMGGGTPCFRRPAAARGTAQTSPGVS